MSVFEDKQPPMRQAVVKFFTQCIAIMMHRSEFLVVHTKLSHGPCSLKGATPSLSATGLCGPSEAKTSNAWLQIWRIQNLAHASSSLE